KAHKNKIGTTVIFANDASVVFETGDTNVLTFPRKAYNNYREAFDNASGKILEEIIADEIESGVVQSYHMNLKRWDGEELFLICRDVNYMNWRIYNMITVDEIQKMAFRSLLPSLSIDFLIIIVLISILLYVAHIITKPILSMQKAMKQFTQTGNLFEIEYAQKDEIGDLAQTLNTMQSTLIQREKDLQKLDIAKSSFLNMVSHEIRTPLNGIIGSAFFLKDHYADTDMADFVDMLTESAERLESLSKKALLITELQSRRDVKLKQKASIKPLIMEVLNDNDALLKEKQISVNLNLSNEQLDLINDAFKYAVNEIVSNTCRYAERNSTLTINLHQQNDLSILSFNNQGNQIASDVIEFLGKPFVLGQEHYDKHTGLGLALVATIMEMHDGEFGIENKPDSGVITKMIFKSMLS
ncbi:MAG: HAMP domain-containing sensor histidine kinase, partial [Ignavibacteria bacterium]|nr:HAMP domain-containing sensor histidine kinase [Ignavibacteria bacterium]